MRKILRSTFGHLFNKNWVLAATLICGVSVFTACSSNDDNPAGQTDVSAISDKVWAFSQTHPDGFTLDIRTMTEPTEGIAVRRLAEWQGWPLLFRQYKTVPRG